MTYREGLAVVRGEAEYFDDVPAPPGALHMAIYRSPYPHAKIKRVDVGGVLERGGLAYGPDDLSKAVRNPFPLAVESPIKYYPFAVGKARFAGEPVAIVLADDPYKALDLLEYVSVDFEPLEPVATIEDALRGKALVHEELGTNVVLHRRFKYGDVDGAFSRGRVVREDFRTQRHNAMPLETYRVMAQHTGDGYTIWANVQGPATYVYFVSRALGVPHTRLRIIGPRMIGGSYGIKYSLYPYMTLAAAASALSGRPVRWAESRTEHFAAAGGQGERIGSVELAVGEGGKILGIRYKFVEDVGAYPRPPEPGALFRVFSVLNGAYDVRAVEADFTVVLTNRLPTGLNRGYGGPQFYFALETAVDKAAEELGLDPFEFRLRNLIEEFPKALAGDQFYETPTGGLYPRQDYAAVLRALEPEYRRLKASRRPGLGVGLAVVVEPSGTNLGYVDLAVEPEKRRYPHSGSGEYVTIWVDPAGYIGVRVNSTNEGLGHETALAEVVAGELGVDPEAVRVEYKVDTAHLWGLASGSYSSRFAPVVASASILAARRLVEKLTPLAAWLLKAEAVRYEGGVFVDAGDPKRRLELRRLASAVQWDPGSLPEGLTADLSATVYFQPPTVKAPSGDFVNSSATYSIQAHLAVVEVDPDTCQIKVVKYAVAHDAGRIIKRELLDGQLYGSIMLGINMALNEELKYSEDGTPLTTLFDAYESYTLGDVVGLEVDLIHFETPAKFLPSGAHGAGEGPVMGAPAAIANAVADATGKRIAELPIKPWRLCT